MSAPAAGFRLRRVETDRGHRWARVGGRGPFLLYLHGVGDIGSINPLLRRLADHYTIVRPDHPGFLGTDGAGCASVGDVAAYHVDLLEALGREGEEGDGVVIVGSSFGGWVAAELALLAPTCVASLVLIDPAGLSGAEPAPDLYALDPATMVRMSFHAPDLKAGAENLDDATRGVLRSNLAAARRVAPTMSDPTLAGRLPALSLPVTVVWGAEDEIFPVSYLEEWRRVLPHARTGVVEDAGHLPHVERLDELLSFVCPSVPSR